MRQAWSLTCTPAACAAIVAAIALLVAAESTGEVTATASEAVADLYIGLLEDISLELEANAVDKLGRGLGWAKMSPDQAILMNAETSYYGEWNGHKILVAGDGTNDVFSIVLKKGFSATEFLKRLRQVIAADPAGGGDSLGQRNEVYRLGHRGRHIGLLMATSGTAPAVEGTGSVGFISASRAAREGIGSARGDDTDRRGVGWPEEAKDAYVQRCSQSMKSQGLQSSKATPYCRCFIDKAEKEFGAREYDAMMKAQPNPRGSEVDRRLYNVFASCANHLPS